MPSPPRILDIGTGSGLIALMLAQRFPEAHIDAIDIDESAVNQAQANFDRALRNALFSSRENRTISASLASLQQWTGGPYDLIVSNPPYFRNSLKNPDPIRTQARHTDTLSYEDLITHSLRLLSPQGQIALILPAETETKIRALAAEHLLSIARITRVYTKESKPARRIMIALTPTINSLHTNATIIEETLVLENEKGGRSAAYQALTKDFYL